MIMTKYVEYNTTSLMDGGNIKSIFKTNLYDKEFLEKFTNYILSQCGNNHKGITSEINENNQQIKLTYINASAAGTALISQNENTLFTLSYYQLLYTFITTNEEYKAKIKSLVPNEIYQNLMQKPDLYYYLINVFRFSDSKYQNSELLEMSSILLSL